VVWDAAGRRRLADEPLPVKEGAVRSVAFNPDSRTLAAGYGGGGVGGGGGGVVLWDMDLESWERLAGPVAHPHPTREEWRQYFPEGPAYHTTFPALPDPEAPSSGKKPL